jgi:hypothetical protein
VRKQRVSFSLSRYLPFTFTELALTYRLRFRQRRQPIPTANGSDWDSGEEDERFGLRFQRFRLRRRIRLRFRRFWLRRTRTMKKPKISLDLVLFWVWSLRSLSQFRVVVSDSMFIWDQEEFFGFWVLCCCYSLFWVFFFLGFEDDGDRVGVVFVGSGFGEV